MALSTAVDILHIVGRCLKMTSCIITLGYEDVIVYTALQRLIQRDWWALKIISNMMYIAQQLELTMNFSSTLPRRSNPGASSR
jgi:hypothetical protein